MSGEHIHKPAPTHCTCRATDGECHGWETVRPLFCPACRCPECGSDTATGVSGDDFVTCENGHRNANDVPHSERCPNAHIFDCPNCAARVEPVFSQPPLRDATAPHVLHVSVRCPNGCV